MYSSPNYLKKKTSPEEAVALVPSNCRVVAGHACGEPTFLLEKLCERSEELENVEIVHMVALGSSRYAVKGMEKAFRHNSLFVGKGTRQAVKEGRADFTPCAFSDIPRLFQDGMLPVDVAIIQVSPPNRDGYCSFGVSVDYTITAARRAGLVIAEINEQMPYTFPSLIHIDEIDVIVETNHPLIQVPPDNISEVERKIGENVADLIPDGATLQMGIGGIPDATLKGLRGKKDLGIHTEMFSDGVVDLYREGVVNNKAKDIHNGKFVASFLMGTTKLYDFAHQNPLIEMLPVEYVNDINVISRHTHMISLNSAVEIDLTGQINAEAVDGVQISAVGGQLDFVMGARKSRCGKAIIALPSTALGESKSRIVPTLIPGTPVTTPRHQADYVVTEYGIAELRGKTLVQRAKELISVAHPKFRDFLEEELEKFTWSYTHGGAKVGRS